MIEYQNDTIALVNDMLGHARDVTRQPVSPGLEAVALTRLDALLECLQRLINDPTARIS
jgi:hypothetical protein